MASISKTDVTDVTDVGVSTQQSYTNPAYLMAKQKEMTYPSLFGPLAGSAYVRTGNLAETRRAGAAPILHRQRPGSGLIVRAFSHGQLSTEQLKAIGEYRLDQYILAGLYDGSRVAEYGLITDPTLADLPASTIHLVVGDEDHHFLCYVALEPAHEWLEQSLSEMAIPVPPVDPWMCDTARPLFSVEVAYGPAVYAGHPGIALQQVSVVREMSRMVHTQAIRGQIVTLATSETLVAAAHLLSDRRHQIETVVGCASPEMRKLLDRFHIPIAYAPEAIDHLREVTAGDRPTSIWTPQAGEIGKFWPLALSTADIQAESAYFAALDAALARDEDIDHIWSAYVSALAAARDLRSRYCHLPLAGPSASKGQPLRWLTNAEATLKRATLLTSPETPTRNSQDVASKLLPSSTNMVHSTGTSESTETSGSSVSSVSSVSSGTHRSSPAETGVAPFASLATSPASASVGQTAREAAETFEQSFLARNWGLISPEVQARLQDTVIFAAGVGLASQMVVQAARIGVRHFILADGDTVETSNLNRQAFNTTHIGQNKAVATAEELRAIAPTVEVEVIPTHVDRQSYLQYLRRATIVVNSIDFDNPALFELNHDARALGIPVLSPLNLGWGSVVLVFTPDSQTLEEFLGLDAPIGGLATNGTLQRQVPTDILDRLIAQIYVRVPGGVPSYLARLFAQFQQRAGDSSWTADPQLGPTTAVTAAMLVRAAVALVAEEPVRSVPDINFVDLRLVMG